MMRIAIDAALGAVTAVVAWMAALVWGHWDVAVIDVSQWEAASRAWFLAVPFVGALIGVVAAAAADYP